jgi:osmoprotectant transport system ATP-binding protein
LIEASHLVKRYDERTVVDDVSFTVGEGECLALIGGSGCGKSTTLRMINRLIEPDGGEIRIDGEDVRSLKPEILRRRIGYAIQSTGLFPHWSVARNVATVPTLLDWPRARIDARVDEMLALVGLPPDQYRDRDPRLLSGGQQQRVGIARALAADPKLVLMDEPFGALDPITRAGLQQELARIIAETGKSVIIVTHDIDEALSLGTRICVMRAGRVLQIATPHALLEAPADDHVRSLVGSLDLGLRLLATETVESRAMPGDAAGAPAIDAGDTLRTALSRMIETRAHTLRVEGGKPRHLSRDDVIGR